MFTSRISPPTIAVNFQSVNRSSTEITFVNLTEGLEEVVSGHDAKRPRQQTVVKDRVHTHFKKSR